MLKYFSALDILKIPEFNELTVFDLIHKENDERISILLYHCGADIDKGVKIQACNHRTLDHKIVTSYRYVFLERSDKEWLSNPNCSMSARIHSQEDKWLAADMVRASAEGINGEGFRAMCVGAIGRDGTTKAPQQLITEDWQEDRLAMLALRNIQADIRGYIHPDEDMFAEEKDKYTI